MPSRESREGGVEDATLRLVLDHAGELLRFARRFSHCADDAHDAYQRAVEILVRRMRVDPPEQPLSWLRTVLRHEALAVRAEREQLLGHAELDLDRHEDRAIADPAEWAVGHERVRHTAEALGRLKPQEATALVLRAEGLSYAEICQRTGWTYTKTNRCVTEGRRALLERLGAIESGAECTRWLPLLSALADGEASARQLADLRPHLRACPACRATLRDCHAAPAQVAALVPPAVVAVAGVTSQDSLLGHVAVGLHALAERTTLTIARIQGALEALPAAKVAAVAASTAALAGGGVALDHASREQAAPPPAAARVTATTTPAGSLDTRLFLPGAARSEHSRRRQPATSAGEFARDAAAPPAEFPSRTAPRPEFAAAPTPSAPAAATAHSAATPPSRSEFGAP